MFPVLCNNKCLFLRYYLLFIRALSPRFPPRCWRTLATQQRLHQHKPAGLPLPQKEASGQAEDEGNNASSTGGVHRHQAASGIAPTDTRGGRGSTTRADHVGRNEPTLPQEV